MHDSEQEHSGITGCRVTYESTIFYNEANKFSIIVVKTNDPRIPLQACSDRYYGDRMLRFTAVGYELPRTKAVELELDGEWVESKYGYQLQVEQWQEIVPQTADGLLAYLGSGLIKGIGPKTAEDIVATFGPDTLNILDNEPEKLLQIRGITEGKLKDIEESYAESRVLRNLMSLLGPFKITPATALKIYQHFGPACVDILKKCPYDLCQISGFGFKRVDGIVRKTDNRLHSTERIKGAVLYTLEDARSKSGHLFLPSEDLVKETLLLLNAPIPIPEQRVRTEEVQETLQQMILHGAVVAYKQYLYSPRVFGQEDDTARMIAERLANISVAENIESALESVRESLGITLSQKQEQAVRTAFQHGLTIITGSPGTGKTTVLKAIIEVFKNLHPKGKFALMAPTGRASRRMAESTGVDEARTLHSALGLGTGEEVGDGERVRFVDADLVIVDEFSMVDMWLAQQIADSLGVKLEIVDMSFDGIIPAVQSGQVDLGIAAFTNTPERAEEIDFSDLYETSAQLLIVKAGNADTYSTKESLAGLKVGAQKGTIQSQLIQSALPESELFELEKYPALALEVQNGNIAGLVVDQAVGEALVATSNGALEVSNFEFSAEEASFGKSVVIAKGNEDLVEAVNEVINKVTADGSYQQAYDEAVELAASLGL